MLSPSETVSDDQGGAESENHLGNERIKTEQFRHWSETLAAPAVRTDNLFGVRHCYVLSVFTRHGVGGNPLGVITDVSGLPEARMQQVAADLGFSETVFLDWREGGVPVARIFTPARELPFAGHPLVGSAYVLDVLGPGGPGRLRCAVGEVVYRANRESVTIETPHGQPVQPSSLEVDGAVSAWVVSMPMEYHVVQLPTPADVASFAPSADLELYLWAWEEEGHAIKARFFAPEFGLVEDPATGSAAVALSQALSAMGMKAGRVEIHQGDEIDAPSTIELEWGTDRVSVRGVVSLMEVRELAV